MREILFPRFVAQVQTNSHYENAIPILLFRPKISEGRKHFVRFLLPSFYLFVSKAMYPMPGDESFNIFAAPMPHPTELTTIYTKVNSLHISSDGVYFQFNFHDSW
jgi:hypothetical protein